VKVVGDVSKFPSDISQRVLEYVSESKPSNHLIDVVFALGYGGRDEITRAVKEMMKDGVSAGVLNEELLTKYLDMQEDVDLLIRTGGMVRTSGLYIWQAAYAEMYFTDVLCPDFDASELEKAILDFTRRVRNFGH
ncbi:undecaprenyl diphosphate synthase family protein, partial [candidate division WWE3 bacterium]|nr:undecaprenyl diphosphate synthase family protein [candidate division WWE3 bacterium]